MTQFQVVRLALICDALVMNPDPLLSAAHPIPAHAVLALLAIVIGAVQFALPKGTPLHRVVGYFWVISMFIVATSSFFINEFRWVGPFGPIHLLSCLVLFSLWRGLAHARRKNIKAHKFMMVSLYWQALLLTGLFTLVPGRIMHEVMFG